MLYPSQTRDSLPFRQSAIYILLFAFCFPIALLSATVIPSGTVDVYPTVYFADWTQRPGIMSLTLSNTSPDSVRCRVKTRLDHDSYGNILNANSRPAYTIPGGGTMTLDNREFADFSAANFNAAYRNQVVQTGRLMEGVYHAYFTVLNAGTNESLGATSLTFYILAFNAPELISPADSATIQISNQVFAYTAATTHPGFETHNELRIWRVPSGYTPAQAANGITFFQTTIVNATMYAYRNNDPQFDPNQLYVWNVKATDRDGRPIGENEGTSRYRTFWTPGTGQPSALRLIAPPDGSTIAVPEPVFEWSATPPAQGSYRICFWEMLPGQTKTQATGNPPFCTLYTTATTFRCDSGYPSFDTGKSYVWRVTTGGVRDSLRVSNVWSFVFPFHFLFTFPLNPEKCWCSYDAGGKKMWHFDGPDTGEKSWQEVEKKECKYAAVKTKDGYDMYHCELRGGELDWVKQGTQGKKCNCILAINGMFHCDGKKWDKVADEECTAAYAIETGEGSAKKMFHFERDPSDQKTKWVKQDPDKVKGLMGAVNGMYLSNGREWVKQPEWKCRCVLALNGMFHFDGKGWVKVPEVVCTYAFASTYNVKENKEYADMVHFEEGLTGPGWYVVTNKARNTYVSACNGVFVQKGPSDKPKWEPAPTKQPVFGDLQGQMYEYDKKAGSWKTMYPPTGTIVNAINGTYQWDEPPEGAGWVKIH